MQEEEEKKKKEEQERQEHEAYLLLKESFEVHEEGFEKVLSETEVSCNCLFCYIQERKC